MIPQHCRDVRYYNIHGVVIEFSTTSPVIQGELLNPFSGYRCRRTAHSDISVTLEVIDSLIPAQRRINQLTPVYSRGELKYFVEDAHSIITIGERGIFYTGQTALEVTGYLDYGIAAEPFVWSSLTWNAVEPLLRARGLFTIHACAASYDNRAILLVGSSGSGKTTTGLCLARAGWTILSDDRPFLSQDTSSVDVLHRIEPLSISPATASFFPELQGTLDVYGSDILRRIDIHNIYPDAIGTCGSLSLVLFPEVSQEGKSRFTRVSQGTALATMCSHSLDIWDRNSVTSNFALLASIAATVPAYRLYLGQDFDILPQQILGLLAV